MGTGKLLGQPNKLWGNDLQWTSVPSRGSTYTPSHFMLQKPVISSGNYDPVGSKASFFFYNKFSLYQGYFSYILLLLWLGKSLVLKRFT